MASIVGDVNVMTSLLFGGTSSGMQDVIRREHEQFSLNLNPAWSPTMVQRTNFMYDAFNGHQAMQQVQNALNQVNSATMADVVYQFRTIEQFQTAQPLMQEYIMANPVIRKAYHAQQCDGYSDTYVDPAPGVIGFGHRQYEEVMEGVVILDEDDKSHYANYSDAWISETAYALSIEKKAALLNSFSVLERLFAEGDRDPVSPWGSAL